MGIGSEHLIQMKPSIYYHVHPMNPLQRASVQRLLAKSPDDILFAVYFDVQTQALVASDPSQVISTLFPQSPKSIAKRISRLAKNNQHHLYAADLQIILNTALASLKAASADASTSHHAIETWSPVCLPGYNPSQFLFMYTSRVYQNKEGSSELAPVDSTSSTAIALIATSQQAFYTCSQFRKHLESQIELKETMNLSHLRPITSPQAPMPMDSSFYSVQSEFSSPNDLHLFSNDLMGDNDPSIPPAITQHAFSTVRLSLHHILHYVFMYHRQAHLCHLQPPFTKLTLDPLQHYAPLYSYLRQPNRSVTCRSKTHWLVGMSWRSFILMVTVDPMLDQDQLWHCVHGLYRQLKLSKRHLFQ